MDRLCRWQSALFPGGTSGITRIAVGRVRSHADAMQIVSGALGREVVHYEAPPSPQVTAEMDRFLRWFERTRPLGGAAAINGITRAALVRVYGLAHQMLKTRSACYDALNATQRLRGIALEAQAIDVTPWVQWFALGFTRACVASQAVVTDATEKAHFRLRAARCTSIHARARCWSPCWKLDMRARAVAFWVACAPTSTPR